MQKLRLLQTIELLKLMEKLETLRKQKFAIKNCLKLKLQQIQYPSTLRMDLFLRNDKKDEAGAQIYFDKALEASKTDDQRNKFKQ